MFIESLFDLVFDFVCDNILILTFMFALFLLLKLLYALDSRSNYDSSSVGYVLAYIILTVGFYFVGKYSTNLQVLIIELFVILDLGSFMLLIAKVSDDWMY